MMLGFRCVGGFRDSSLLSSDLPVQREVTGERKPTCPLPQHRVYRRRSGREAVT